MSGSDGDGKWWRSPIPRSFAEHLKLMVRRYKHTVACREVASHLQLQLDTKIRTRACREIRRHLEHCQNCTAYLDSLKKTILLYKKYPDPRVPKRMRQKLLAILKLQN